MGWPTSFLKSYQCSQSSSRFVCFGSQSHFSWPVVLLKFNCCSDFRYESNGIFVLGVGFFSSDKFRLFN